MKNTLLTFAPIAALALSAVLANFVVAGSAQAADTPVEKSSFGKLPDGTEVELYTLRNKKGVTAKITTYGARVTHLLVPDKQGKLGDIVLGHDSVEGYLEGDPYFGTIAGRYANRIAKGRFTLDGKEYTLATNNGPNSLHGGTKGFDKRVWTAQPVVSKDGPAVAFTYTSADGEEGYPGALTVTVVYTLTENNTLRLEYTAVTSKTTPINVTNHTYFNLAGQGDVRGYEVKLSAANYTPVDDTLIPTGKIDPVSGTPLDFTKVHTIGERIDEIKGGANGYDHNFVRDNGSKFGPAAQVYDPSTGRVLEMYTDQPGFQFYTGNFLDGSLTGKNGTKYTRNAGFCLEAQHYPDSPNQPSFPTTLLHPGEVYHQHTEYRFTTK